jgi:hypothetical protein
MAHVRRKFVDVFSSQGSAIAEEVIRRIALLYTIEKEIRGMAPQDRVAVRQARAKPVFDQLEEWLHAQLPRLSGKSPLAQAIRYALGRMPKARPYLSNGHLELDNNETLFAIGSRTMVERRTRCQAGGHRAKKLDVFRLRGGRQSHGYRLHADRNRQTEQRRPPSLAYLGSGPNRRLQDHSVGRVAPLALRCFGSVTGHAGRTPEH